MLTDPNLIELPPEISVQVYPVPSPNEILELSVRSGADEGAAKALLAAEARYRTEMLYLEATLSVFMIGPEPTLHVWESDYAFTSAVRHTLPPGAGLPLFGGPLGIAVLPVCSDAVVMMRRSLDLLWAPGILRPPGEGIVMSDLSGSGLCRWLNVETLAHRLCSEELGPASLDAAISPVGLSTRPGQVDLLCVARLNCTFAELAASVEVAPDGDEGVPVCFADVPAALAAMGDDTDNASGLLLRAAVYSHT